MYVNKKVRIAIGCLNVLDSQNGKNQRKQWTDPFGESTKTD